MDVPVALNLPIGKSTGSGVDLIGSDSKELSGREFSEHLGENVDRLKTEQKERHTEPSSKADKVRVAAAKGGEAIAKNHTFDGENEVPVEAGLPIGLEALMEDGTVLEQAPGLSTAITVISEKRQLDVSSTGDHISGNELPQAADINAKALSAAEAEELLADQSVVNFEMQDKKIIFDPLSQATEKSAQIAASTVGHLPSEKVKFNGKNNAAEFFNSSSVGLPIDKSNNVDVHDVILDRLQKPIQETNPVASIAKDMSAIKSDMATIKMATDGVQPPPAIITTAEAKLSAAIDRPTIQLDTPMNSSRWGESFGQRVQWVVNQSMSGAQIRLNPQNMGPIEVRIQMQNDQAVVSFTAQHGATREAIDAALPRLREMLSEQNVNVVDIDVSQHSFAEQRDHQMSNNGDDKDHLSNTDQESEDSVFDQQDNEQQRQYSGLFSDFA